MIVAGDCTRSLRHDGLERTYLVHVPPAIDANRPTPLVVALHGGASSGPALMRSSGLSDKADEAGFVVVYPDGVGEKQSLYYWNAGGCCGVAKDRQSDDVGFILAMLDELAVQMTIDSGRVYATGLSNGAMLAYRLASEHAERFAAIGPVAGPMTTETCSPSRPVSVIHFHGTQDDFTPLDGGVGRRSVTRTHHYSVEHTIRAWASADGCGSTPRIELLPVTKDDGMSVERRVYGPGRDGAEVVLYVVHGGGHTWPGRPANSLVFGKSTRQISANDLMWEFFAKHARQ